MKEIILKIPAFSRLPEPAPLSPLVYDLYTSGIQREHMQKVNIGLKEKLCQTNPSSKWIANLKYCVSLMGLQQLYMCRKKKLVKVLRWSKLSLGILFFLMVQMWQLFQEVWSKSVTVPAPGSSKHSFFDAHIPSASKKTICLKGLTLWNFSHPNHFWHCGILV